MAYRLISGLSALPGIDVFVVVLNEGRLSDEFEQAGIPAHVLNEGRQSFVQIVRSAAKVVRSWSPHLLHSHRYKENILSYLISFALKGSVPLVNTQHGMPELYGSKPALMQRLKTNANYRLLATKFEKTVAVSVDIKESLIRHLDFNEDRVEMIHNGVYVPQRIQPSKEKKGFVIGSAGRLVPVKDYRLMVEVAREISARTDDVCFELAGDGPMLEDIQTLIKERGLQDRFTLRAFLHDVDTFYRGLDVYLNTSLHEGIPMSVLEAMAYEIPSIVPRVGGLEEIVTDGLDGYLVDSRDPRHFADRCLALYNNEALRQKMAHAARKKIIEQFSVERMVRSYFELYMKTVDKTRTV